MSIDQTKNKRIIMMSRRNGKQTLINRAMNMNMIITTVIATTQPNKKGVTFTVDDLKNMAETWARLVIPVEIEYNPSRRVGRVKELTVKNGELIAELELSSTGVHQVKAHIQRSTEKKVYSIPGISTDLLENKKRLMYVGICHTTLIPVASITNELFTFKTKEVGEVCEA